MKQAGKGNTIGKGIGIIEGLALKADQLPLWWAGFILAGIVLIPNFVLGEGSVFVVHDQLDESMMNYVLTARHPGESILPEILGGTNADGLHPSAFLFALLYRALPAFPAFLCTYAVILLCGFLGMYLAVVELTDSSILAVAVAGIFCIQPFYPVYGLSVMGVPLALYAFLCLCREKRKAFALGVTAFFGMTSYLVYTGYAVLGFWLVALIVLAVRKKPFQWSAYGFLLLLAVYLATSFDLIRGAFGGSCDFVSHRVEMLSSPQPFWDAAWDLFLGNQYHAPSYHRGFVLPIVVLLAAAGIVWRKLCAAARRRCAWALGGFAVLVGIALFYGVCKSETVTAWRNSGTSFLFSFQIERFYWLYPAGWYLELALVLSIWWTEMKRRLKDNLSIWGGLGLCLLCLVIAAILYPTADEVLKNSYFYMNVNQYNNGSGITGYISWESWYAEDLMQEIDDAIGRDKATYRVAHLGINPAPALMHGFYTVDGYSDNYSLEYKHAFRRVIAAELDMAPEAAVYFDAWGSRCYLFNSQTGNYWMMRKGNDIKYEGLKFDMDALGDLGCEYLFSGAEIVDAERMGLEPMGYFETETSYWGIWLYALK